MTRQASQSARVGVDVVYRVAQYEYGRQRGVVQWLHTDTMQSRRCCESMRISGAGETPALWEDAYVMTPQPGIKDEVSESRLRRSSSRPLIMSRRAGFGIWLTG